MGIVRDLYYARKISAGLKLPAPTVALLIKRLALAAAMGGGGGGTEATVTGNLPLVLQNAIQHSIKSLTRYGLCTQDGTPTPSAPVDIVCNNGALKWDSVNQRVYADGTPEVLTVSGPNLLNPETNITGKYITGSGGISNGADAQYTDLIPVTVGATYTWSLISNRPSGGNNRWHGYKADGTWKQQIAWNSTGAGIGLPFSLTATIPNGVSYVRLSYGINDTEVMFGTPATDYQPYAPQTASVPMLLSVGDYKDEGELISGIKTERVGVLVLDGSLGWKYLNGAIYAPLVPSGILKDDRVGMCTNFKIGAGTIISEMSDGDFIYNCTTGPGGTVITNGNLSLKSSLFTNLATALTWLDANKPLLVYPLATPTTEQTTAQHLATNEGTNIVDSVANVSPLEAEVKYMAASAQDVLSTLLGMKVTKQDISTQDAENMIDIITGEENK